MLASPTWESWWKILIGHDVEMTTAPKVPKAHRLVLEDHSKAPISS
jgi:glucose-1-phosphate thymidylyltransferase